MLVHRTTIFKAAWSKTHLLSQKLKLTASAFKWLYVVMFHANRRQNEKEWNVSLRIYYKPAKQWENYKAPADRMKPMNWDSAQKMPRRSVTPSKE